MIGNVNESTIYEELKHGLTMDTKGVDVLEKSELNTLLEKTNHEVNLVLSLFDGDFYENQKLANSEMKVCIVKKYGLYDKVSKRIIINRVKKILDNMYDKKKLNEDACTDMQKLIEKVILNDIDIRKIKCEKNVSMLEDRE